MTIVKITSITMSPFHPISSLLTPIRGFLHFLQNFYTPSVNFPFLQVSCFNDFQHLASTVISCHF
uniref:Uncharacterized protein n=1 Tax=Rhizophora mucronata TaxID=61149 RepID=A0A2P2PIL5_RHIMU